MIRIYNVNYLLTMILILIYLIYYKNYTKFDCEIWITDFPYNFMNIFYLSLRINKKFDNFHYISMISITFFQTKSLSDRNIIK